VIGQAGLATLLSLSALTLVKSYAAVVSQELGFELEGRLSFQMSVRGVPDCECALLSKQSAFYNDFLDVLAALPGLVSVGMTSELPLLDAAANVEFQGEGTPQATAYPMAAVRTVSPSYLKTLGVRLVAGRHFDAFDTQHSQAVAIVGETMARTLGSASTTVGRRFRFNPRNGNGEWITVVGVAADVKHAGLRLAAEHDVYLPHTQSPAEVVRVVVWTQGPPTAVVGPLRAAVREFDPLLSIDDVKTLAEVRHEAAGRQAFLLVGLSAFAMTVLLLSAVGVYGLQAYAVESRRAELATRLAIGADPQRILLSILGDGTRVWLLGILLGGVAYLAVVRQWTDLLFRVSPFDEVCVLATTAITLAAIATGSYLPARTAGSVDIALALRAE
jgi:hypothetical protein